MKRSWPEPLQKCLLEGRLSSSSDSVLLSSQGSPGRTKVPRTSYLRYNATFWTGEKVIRLSFMSVPLKELCHWCRSWRLHQRVVWKSFPLLEDLSTVLQQSRTGYFRCWTPFWETPRKAADPLDSSTMTQTQCSGHPRIVPDTCQHGNLRCLAAWTFHFKMLINSTAEKIKSYHFSWKWIISWKFAHVTFYWWSRRRLRAPMRKPGENKQFSLLVK